MVKLSSVDRARAIVHLEARWKRYSSVPEYHIQTAALIQGCTWPDDLKDRRKSVRPRITTDRMERSIRLVTLRNHHITARRLQMRYLGRHGRRVSVHTSMNRLRASQLKYRKAAQKPLLIDGVTIEFIDDQWQSCLWAVAHYWHTIGSERFWQISAGPHLSSPGHICRLAQ